MKFIQLRNQILPEKIDLFMVLADSASVCAAEVGPLRTAETESLDLDSGIKMS